MNLIFPSGRSTRQNIQSKLLRLAAVFLVIYALTLTLSPAARMHDWYAAYHWQHWTGVIVWMVGFALLRRKVDQVLPESDPFLLPLAAILSGLGLMTIWRLDPGFGLRQTAWFGFSFAIVWGLLEIPSLLTWLRRYKYIWLVCGLLITSLTFFFGTYPGGFGPKLWLGCCGLYFQPSEPLKLLLIIFLAAYLADRLPFKIQLFSLLIPTLILLAASVAILLGQHDLGTASLFLFIYTLVIFLGTGKRRLLIISLITILAAGFFGYLLFDVIRIRIDAWINPWQDPSGRSFQIVQSLLAIAAGGFFGMGPGMGNPGLVPVPHSDFIFSAVAEELGLFGTFGILILLALLLARGFQASLNAGDPFQRGLAAGITAYLVGQSIFIIGGNIRLLPLTGVTLPFVSYGGSSLASSFLALLLLLLVSNNRRKDELAAGSPQPFIIGGGLILSGLVGIALVNGWWATIRSSDLLSRTDNQRRAISDRYVRRGSLFDRKDLPLNETVGIPGQYLRRANYPELAATVGYTHPVYGQSGLEASLDGYLRGLDGNPNSLFWVNSLLYGQPPAGLNIRLSLDLEMQQSADRILGYHKGALVLLNARTGEVLALASHPSIDPNLLDVKWKDWVNDTTSPFLNRAVQGLYPPGGAIAPFLLAQILTTSQLPNLPADLDWAVNGRTISCGFLTPGSASWGGAISNGCPGALARLERSTLPNQLISLLKQMGFFEAPVLQLETAAALKPPDRFELDLTNPEKADFRVTPLQMALAAAAMSREGMRPSPRLALSVQTPTQGWVILPSGPTITALNSKGAEEAAQILAANNLPFWQTTATVEANPQPITWYVAGSLPGWEGTPLAISLVIEEANPFLARYIGQSVLQAAQKH